MRKVVLLCVVVCSMIAFAAEPTTSTEYDMREGRAHGAYVATGAVVARTAVATAASTPMAPTLLATLTALLAIALATRANGALVTHDGRDRSALRWATSARRGPPAHA